MTTTATVSYCNIPRQLYWVDEHASVVINCDEKCEFILSKNFLNIFKKKKIYFMYYTYYFVAEVTTGVKKLIALRIRTWIWT